jgi:aspartyl-tRNA(Asn)/glutamyl-tRNA(Gln) amidotransferase subunit A
MSGGAADIAAGVAARRFSAEEVATATLSRIRAHDGDLRAYLRIDEEGALRSARDVDVRVRAGERLPLAGVPIAIKDAIVTRGLETTCASRMLEGWVPPYDATVVERLRAAGAVITGKANMDEFAMGSSTETSAFGPTRNPWDPERSPGGSSGGSAAAVATNLCAAALGSDTGGSIRQPAALCGVVGVKPTYGRVSRYGLVAFASSLDQIGPLARSVEDAALVLEAIAGHDPRDATSVGDAPPLRTDDHVGVQGLRIGVPREYFAAGLDSDVEAAVRAAIDALARLGALVVEVSLPHSPLAVAAYYLICTAEASANLARFDGIRFGRRAAGGRDLLDMYLRTRAEGFGAEVKRRILLGTYVLSAGYYDAYYAKAQKVRTLICRDFAAAFSSCDLLVGPTSPTAAFRLGEHTSDPLSLYLADVFTIAVNLAGLPGMSLPCGTTRGGLPIGLQIIAPAFAEARMLGVARAYERATTWHERRPPAWVDR